MIKFGSLQSLRNDPLHFIPEQALGSLAYSFEIDS
jgi:hypothetical protein